MSESFRCYNCSQEYEELRGLRNHERYCRSRIEGEEESDGDSSALKRARRSNSESSPDPDPRDIDEIDTTMTDITPEIEASPESPPNPASFSFSGRRRRVPRALKDYIPHSLVGLPSHLRPPPPKPTLHTEPEVPNPVSTPDPEPEADTEFRTESNGFGLYRQYTRKPRSDPEGDLTLADLADDDMPEQHRSDAAASETPCPSSSTVDFFHPFPNATVFRYINWYLGTSGTLSAADLDRLAREVISSDDFNPADLRNFNTARELARLDKHGSSDVPFAAKDGWKEVSVTLHVPNAKYKHASEDASPQFNVSGVHYRPLLELIKAACQSSQAKEYHWVPFKLVHQSPSADLRTYTDIYNSDAMLEEDAKIRSLGPHPGDDSDTEVAVLAMLFWSDSTHLTTFGTASLWPVYLYFGNHSKYARARPNAHTAHHVAYIPSVSLDPVLHLQDGLSYPSSLTVSRTFI